MEQVTELGYMGLGVKDLDAWKHFAAAILGLQVVDDDDGCRLRMDYWHHRIALHPNGDDDLAYLGFRVAGSDELAAMQARLSAAGITVRRAASDEAAERHVLELVKLADPNGIPIEIFHGPEVQYSHPFHPGRAMHGRFKTGAGGLGHCIVGQRDPAAAQRFYALLGLRGDVEYQIRMRGRVVAAPIFMHCNERDHTIAFGLGAPDKRINHLMLEVDTFDDVGLTYDLVRRAKIPVAIVPGKHSNDHMYSFYFQNPSGWMCEYGWGARPATHQTEYYVQDIYGHQNEAGGFEP